MKNKPQISDLDVFCVVVESQSFVGAATELGVSPAFISKRIQILEKTLDCKLLNRSTRNISLTEDGSGNVVLNLGEDLDRAWASVGSEGWATKARTAVCIALALARVSL